MRQFAGRAGVDAGVDVEQSMTNSGMLNVGAHAFASAPATTTADGVLPGGAAFAFVGAVGAAQYNAATGTNTQTFVNSGTMNVTASAIAIGTSGSAHAFANGYLGLAAGGVTQHVAIANSGVMNVSATAVAPGTAIASAYGIALRNRTPGTAGFEGHPVHGTVTNAGTINVIANAAAGGTFTTGSGSGATVTLAAATASAAKSWSMAPPLTW